MMRYLDRISGLVGLFILGRKLFEIIKVAA